MVGAECTETRAVLLFLAMIDLADLSSVYSRDFVWGVATSAFQIEGVRHIRKEPHRAAKQQRDYLPSPVRCGCSSCPPGGD